MSGRSGEGQAGMPRWQVDDGIATITLRRAAHRNRLQDEDLQTLLTLIERANADPGVLGLVLTAEVTGARPVFSAGYHLGGFDDDGNTGAMPFERVPDALACARPLTLAALPGSVYGGAIDLALACDFRVGVRGMEARMPAAALGLHYYPSGMRRYVARMGLGAARRFFLDPSPVSDEALLRMGYLDVLCAPDDLAVETQAWGQRVRGLAPLAAQGMKQTLNEMALGESAMTRWREREALSKASADFAEGRSAFAQKRTPRFTGR